MFSKVKNIVNKSAYNTQSVKKQFSFLLHEYQAQNMLNSFKVNTPKVSNQAF